MELSGILGIAALANVIQALPVVESRSSIEARANLKCRPPGEHKCAIVVFASVQSNGLTQGTGTERGVQVVDGNCGNIIANGKLHANGGGKGWSADLTTAYGPHLYFGAYNLGVRTIAGVTYQYNGKSYTQGNCIGTQSFGGDRVVDLPGTVFLRGTDSMQCNFDC